MRNPNIKKQILKEAANHLLQVSKELQKASIEFAKKWQKIQKQLNKGANKTRGFRL